jgi:hypothetical protein
VNKEIQEYFNKHREILMELMDSSIYNVRKSIKELYLILHGNINDISIKKVTKVLMMSYFPDTYVKDVEWVSTCGDKTSPFANFNRLIDKCDDGHLKMFCDFLATFDSCACNRTIIEWFTTILKIMVTKRDRFVKFVLGERFNRDQSYIVDKLEIVFTLATMPQGDFPEKSYHVENILMRELLQCHVKNLLQIVNSQNHDLIEFVLDNKYIIDEDADEEQNDEQKVNKVGFLVDCFSSPSKDRVKKLFNDGVIDLKELTEKDMEKLRLVYGF